MAEVRWTLNSIVLRAVAYLLVLLIACGLAACVWMFVISFQPRKSIMMMGVQTLAGPIFGLSVTLLTCVAIGHERLRRWEKIMMTAISIPIIFCFLLVLVLGTMFG